ncbi:MAG: hypothetical protein ACYSW8_19360 [Planctomycetota bacterium]|jgi:DNA-binding Lrp family transcriptional regulator
MKYKISEVERRILAALQGGFPRTQTPYKDAAERAGISTEELLKVLRNWKDEGKLRRIGAIVHHERVVSHAYERRTAENWRYNVYTMVHGTDIEAVEQTVERMSQACGVSDYRILHTERELKKVPPTYIIDK